MPSLERKFNLSAITPPETEYDRLLRKKDFFDRISNKYTAHTKLLTNIKNFNHMLNEVHRINDYYKLMLDKLDDKDFDFAEYEKNFDKLIEEDINTIEQRNKK